MIRENTKKHINDGEEKLSIYFGTNPPIAYYSRASVGLDMVIADPADFPRISVFILRPCLSVLENNFVSV